MCLEEFAVCFSSCLCVCVCVCLISRFRPQKCNLVSVWGRGSCFVENLFGLSALWGLCLLLSLSMLCLCLRFVRI
jgi:hypothetical protein